MKRLFLMGILFLGLAEFGHGAWIPAKAWLSQVLLAKAWQESLHNGLMHKPWPWADTWPVLKLTHEKSGIDLLVLQGDSGHALAFGPGLSPQSALPGRAGNTIISAHRDTHFDFLQEVKQGDSIIVQNRQGKHLRYQIIATEVIDSKQTRLQIDTDDDRITLVTCYPFNQLSAGGSLRYIVTGVNTPGQTI